MSTETFIGDGGSANIRPERGDWSLIEGSRLIIGRPIAFEYDF